MSCGKSEDGRHHFDRLAPVMLALLHMQRWAYIPCLLCRRDVLILLKRKQRLVLIRD